MSRYECSKSHPRLVNRKSQWLALSQVCPTLGGLWSSLRKCEKQSGAFKTIANFSSNAGNRATGSARRSVSA